jgi:hypothetical protein
MRAPGVRRGIGLAFALALAGLASPAQAGPGSKDTDAIDIDPVKHELKVLSDGRGHFVVVKPNLKGENHLYYGDGKTFHAQRVIGGSADTGRGRFSQYFWAPRSRPQGRADIELKDGVWRVTCDKRETVLNELPPAKAGKILDKASFHKPLWRHQAYSLSRDEYGNYYYVDRLQDDYGGRGFRVWIGQRGAMKKQKLTNIVSDSEGDIFSTKKGRLRLILHKKEGTWIKGKKRSGLTYVPLWKNVYLIYAELGVYLAALGTPCDDL